MVGASEMAYRTWSAIWNSKSQLNGSDKKFEDLSRTQSSSDTPELPVAKLIDFSPWIIIREGIVESQIILPKGLSSHSRF
jgi:hypothetical protein